MAVAVDGGDDEVVGALAASGKDSAKYNLFNIR